MPLKIAEVLQWPVIVHLRQVNGNHQTAALPALLVLQAAHNQAAHNQVVHNHNSHRLQVKVAAGRNCC